MVPPVQVLVALAYQRHSRFGGLPPERGIILASRPFLVEYDARNATRVRPDTQTTAHRAVRRRLEDHLAVGRAALAGQAKNPLILAVEHTSQMEGPFINLAGPGHRKHADLLLPHTRTPCHKLLNRSRLYGFAGCHPTRFPECPGLTGLLYLRQSLRRAR